MLSTFQTPTTSSDHTPNCSSASKFKATVLWHNLIGYIYKNVKQKRRRLIWKGVGPTSCFSGSDVCDTALIYLLMDNENFKTNDLTRIKARKLCQMLLNHDIFEPLSGSSAPTADKKFDDQSNKYYKFVSTIDAAFQQGFMGSPLKADKTDSVRTPQTKARFSSKGSDSHPPVIKGVLCNPNPEEPMQDSPEAMLASPETMSDSPEIMSSSPEVVLDCENNIVTELLGLTSSGPMLCSPLKETNGKRRAGTGYIRRIYNERVLLSKRSSLDCEGVFQHGHFPRNISTGTGMKGVFKRKNSAPNIPENSVMECNGPSADIRRSLRLRKGGPDQSQAKKTFYDTSIGTKKAGIFSNHNSLSSQCSEGVVIERGDNLPEGDMKSLPPSQLSSNKTVEKLAKLTGGVIFSPSAITDIRQEIALSQLSLLIDLPILEGLVCSGSAGSREEPGYDNSVFFNVDQHHSLAMGLNANDTWMKSAIDVFDFMPNGHRITFDYQIGLNPKEYKLALYRSILKNYRGRASPLFPASHEQVHLAVLSMLMAGEEQKAVLTMRLASILLPCYLMAEVSTLLQFLQEVSVTSDPKLKPSLAPCSVKSYQVSNTNNSNLNQQSEQSLPSSNPSSMIQTYRSKRNTNILNLSPSITLL
ncbi:uncharacterized protein [Watersipora subatra]|uniref:uncharacterized protein isoform X2 n=1 Tax=Watersipora subatra TaxID=2589382 RepID=UPI00355B82E2